MTVFGLTGVSMQVSTQLNFPTTYVLITYVLLIARSRQVCAKGEPLDLTKQTKSMKNRFSAEGRAAPERLEGNKDRKGRRWTRKFGCTRKQLRRAKAKVGIESGAVRAELSRTVPLRPE
jgi:hypothetical protein